MARTPTEAGVLVALNQTVGTLFTPEWVQAVRSAPESGMAATGRVYRAKRGPYDPATNDYTLIYDYDITTKMRVQPLRSATPRIIPNNTTDVQTVLFSVPVDALLGVDLRTGDQARVLSAPLNPVLANYTYVVFEIMDSSNPVERTFLCRMDQEEKA